MSAATEFAPAVVIPARARRAAGWDAGCAPSYDVEYDVEWDVEWGIDGFVDGDADRAGGRWGAGALDPVGPARLASVTTLHAPRVADTSAPPLRLTRRGVVVLSAVVAALAGALLWLAARSAPVADGGAGAPAVHAVTVQPGDTLWSIATRVAPWRDPRAEVDALQHANHLASAGLTPGQTLRVP